MDPYPQPLNPAKEESFEAELDQVTHHTEQGPRTALALPPHWFYYLLLIILIIIIIRYYLLFLFLFCFLTQRSRLRFASLQS